jgi:hypothetical protein
MGRLGYAAGGFAWLYGMNTRFGSAVSKRHGNGR